MLLTHPNRLIEHGTAARLAGVLYGNILHRNADSGGYEYYVKTLRSGELPLLAAVKEMFMSDEFHQKFVFNQTPNELIRNLLVSFFGPQLIRVADVAEMLSKLVNEGLPVVLDELINDQRTADFHGDYPIPRYVEGASATLAF